VNRERDKRGDTDGASGRVEAVGLESGVAPVSTSSLRSLVRLPRILQRRQSGRHARDKRCTREDLRNKNKLLLVGAHLLTTLCTSLSGTGMVIVPAPSHVIQSKEL
jgi:hypothetical protein